MSVVNKYLYDFSEVYKALSEMGPTVPGAEAAMIHADFQVPPGGKRL